MLRGNGRFHVRLLGHRGPRLGEEDDERIARSSKSEQSVPTRYVVLRRPNSFHGFAESLQKSDTPRADQHLPTNHVIRKLCNSAQTLVCTSSTIRASESNGIASSKRAEGLHANLSTTAELRRFTRFAPGSPISRGR